MVKMKSEMQNNEQYGTIKKQGIAFILSYLLFLLMGRSWFPLWFNLAIVFLVSFLFHKYIHKKDIQNYVLFLSALQAEYSVDIIGHRKLNFGFHLLSMNESGFFFFILITIQDRER